MSPIPGPPSVLIRLEKEKEKEKERKMSLRMSELLPVGCCSGRPISSSRAATGLTSPELVCTEEEFAETMESQKSLETRKHQYHHQQERRSSAKEHMRSKLGSHHLPADLVSTKLEIERDVEEEGREEQGIDDDDEFEEGDGVVAEATLTVLQQSSKLQQRNLQQSHEEEEQQEQQDLQQSGLSGGGSWESFLPRSQLRVLLAEDDDCTRHVVSALLRNCNYEVTSASNGAIAWELLEKRDFQFDLVLTDVILRCLLGLDLLSKMACHEACKQIPVVMMSTHDSLDIVFSCLSKGAADFLVKPVRKNELKNLWQHVWRRCKSSSIGGSATGIMGKEVVPKSHVGSDNNMTGSNGDSENVSSGLNVRGGSDNGSGNQVQIRVQPVQVQRIHNSHAEGGDGDEEGQATSLAKSTSGTDQEMGQDLEMATPRPASGSVEKSQQPARDPNRTESASAMEEMEVENREETCNEPQEGERSNSGAEESADKTLQRAIDFIGSIAGQPLAAFVERPGDGVETMDQRGSNSHKNSDNPPSESYSPPTLDLSLKRPRARSDMDTDADDRRMLHHSGSSAFSRYSNNGTGFPHQHAPGTTLPPAYQMAAGCGPTHGVMSRGLASSASGPLQAGVPHDQAVGSSKGSGEVSTHVKMHVQPLQSGNGQETSSSGVAAMTQDIGASGSSQVPEPSMQNVQCALMSYEDIPSAYRPTVHPMYYAHPAGNNNNNTWVAAAGPSPTLAECGEVYNHSPALNEHAGPSRVQSQVHFLRSHSEHHHFNSQRQRLQAPGDPQSQQQEKQESTTTKTGSGAPPAFGSSTVLEGKVGHNNSGSSNAQSSRNGNDNSMPPVNVSVSGHNNGNNNGHSRDLTNGMAAGSNGKTGNDGSSGADGMDNRSAIREAALHKFRQKRKDRCFEKKVHYQSRKRLAEQQPRVRGQFVRQNVQDLNVSELD